MPRVIEAHAISHTCRLTPHFRRSPARHMRAHAGEAGAAEAAGGDGWAAEGGAVGAAGATLGAGAGAKPGVGAASSGLSPLQPKTKPARSAAAGCHFDPKMFMA
jgi:hypothetical protein